MTQINDGSSSTTYELTMEPSQTPENRKARPSAPTDTPTPANDDSAFVRRLLIAGLVLILGLALWRLADVLLLVFAAILLAVALRGLSSRVHRVVGNEAASLTIVVVLLITTAALVFLFFGARSAANMTKSSKRLRQPSSGSSVTCRPMRWGVISCSRSKGPTYQTRPDRSRRL